MAAQGITAEPPDSRARRSEGDHRGNVPLYETRLAARHAVFDDTLRGIVRMCPSGSRVLDAGCGDGYYMELFADAGQRKFVTGLDASSAYIRLARNRVPSRLLRRFVQGAAERLPYGDGIFDLVWSAHSMQSYRDATTMIEEAHRVLRRGGSIAILENDRLHARVLPLPAALETALMEKRIAEISGKPPGKAFQARWCEQYLEAAGFTTIRRKTFVFEHQAPWDEPTQQFYALILEDILEESRRLLDGRPLAIAEETLSPDSPNYLGIQDYRYSCELHTLFTAMKK